MKKSTKKTAANVSAKAPAKKMTGARNASKKTTKASTTAKAKKAAKAPVTAKKKTVSTFTRKTAAKATRPVAKNERPVRKSMTAVKAAPPQATRKAAPAKEVKRMTAPVTLPIQRPATRTGPKAPLRGQGLVTPTPQAKTEVHSQQQVQLPDATFDPTPDTNVPLRGHTSFQHNAQTERAAALKGQRARMSNRRKH